MISRFFSRFSFLKYFILLSLVAGLVLSACTATGAENESIGSPTPSSISIKEPDPSPTAEVDENPDGDWLEYTHHVTGLRFLYPADWFGPEVYETEGSLRIEIGSDQVYPYGTSREEQITTTPDSYYILIQYVENTIGRSWDDFIDSGWIDTYLALKELEDNQFILTPRLIATRIGEVSLGDYSGLMYLATLPDSAQTERAYAREVVLFDSELNWLRISATPSMVQIEDTEKWKNDFARVDQAFLEIFLTTLESIEIK